MKTQNQSTLLLQYCLYTQTSIEEEVKDVHILLVYMSLLLNMLNSYTKSMRQNLFEEMYFSH